LTGQLKRFKASRFTASVAPELIAPPPTYNKTAAWRFGLTQVLGQYWGLVGLAS